LAHAKTSENEAPVSPQRVVAALKVAGYMEVGYHFHWSRLNTSRLGALSPSYVVSARKPGQSSAPASVRLRRPLERMGLAGLELDRSCRFIDLVRQQQKEILDIIGSGKPIPD
jgi:hypothetical protein